jgi:DNA segregation ATPase FtsK/SpoIIIE, S-DNA-T family
MNTHGVRLLKSSPTSLGCCSFHAQSTAEYLATQPPPAVGSWQSPAWDSWQADALLEHSLLRTGELRELRGSGTAGPTYVPTEARETGHDGFVIPAHIPFIGQNRAIIVRCGSDTADRGLAVLQSLLVRTTAMLPHQARYTLLDPAGHGIAFPMRRYLPLVRESTGDVRRDLDGVIVDIQRIIESYLDASVRSFEAVPADIRVNERYQFVFAADFPNQYDRRAIEALQSVGNTGAAAGVYLFIHYNQSHELPRDMSMDGFKNAHYVDIARPGIANHWGLELHFDNEPPAEVQDRLFQRIAQAKPPERAIDFDNVAGLEETTWWTGDASRLIETAIGARGGGEPLKLWFGANRDGQPCAHGILGAMTGAGKSNLYHVFILGLATRYSPDELRLYLIDGKDGVEFQAYRSLPHAEVVSLRSSPELSRSVLAELLAEKERRNFLFSRYSGRGVNDLTSYRKNVPEGEHLPRILLLVDEYQELFEGDRDGVASSQLLQLAQQGRSAGIHMLLASQRFGAPGMLNQSAILGNFHLRLAMQMTTADIQALTEFGRRGKSFILTCDLPGKIVVNDRSGDDTANQAGKVALLDRTKLTRMLGALNRRAANLPPSKLPRRIIFDGQRQPNLSDNPDLAQLLGRSSWPAAPDLRAIAQRLEIPDWFESEHPRLAWLGQQFSVRGQAVVIFRRRVSEHLLIIGSNNAARYGMLAAAMSGLALTEHPTECRFIVLDRSVPGADWSGLLEDVGRSVLAPAGFDVTVGRDEAEIESALTAAAAEIDRRRALTEEERIAQPSLYVVLTEADRVERLRRRADTYGGMGEAPLGSVLQKILADGAPLGVHAIISFAGVRAMSHVVDERRGLAHFRHRVALQMSEDESHILTRGRRAAQLQDEGPRPISALYLDFETGATVRFKPYTCEASNFYAGEMQAGASVDSDHQPSLREELKEIGAALTSRRVPA